MTKCVMKPVILLRVMLQPNLYPTVGLQTPGEIVEANFGRSPFVFDIEDYVQVVIYISHIHLYCHCLRCLSINISQTWLFTAKKIV